MGQIKICVPDRNRTHDLLHPLSYENSWRARSFYWVHIWQVFCILLGSYARIGLITEGKRACHYVESCLCLFLESFRKVSFRKWREPDQISEFCSTDAVKYLKDSIGFQRLLVLKTRFFFDVHLLVGLYNKLKNVIVTLFPIELIHPPVAWI